MLPMWVPLIKSVLAEHEEKVRSHIVYINRSGCTKCFFLKITRDIGYTKKLLLVAQTNQTN